MRHLSFMFLFLAACTNLPTKNKTSEETTPASEIFRRPASSPKMICEENSTYPAKFKILENDGEVLKIEVGDLQSPKGNSTEVEYTYDMSFNNVVILQNQKIRPQEPVQINLSQLKTTNEQMDTGAYKFTIRLDGQVLWQQNVFAMLKEPMGLSEEDWADYAKAYSPILSMAANEEYHPASLDYLMNKGEGQDTELESEKVFLANETTMKFKILEPFSVVRELLPVYGDLNTYFQVQDKNKTAFRKRFGKGYETVYYSVFSKFNKKNNTQYFYLNYYFLYAFDPKIGNSEDPALAAHTFDRESITIVFKRSRDIGGALYPTHVIYGAHLAEQQMAIKNKKEKKLLRSHNLFTQSWLGGRVFVPWNQVLKVGSHPLTVAAYGSHGMYPVLGTYLVMVPGSNQAMLEEPSGSTTHILYPKGFADPATSEKFTPYKIEKLQIDNLTSDCNHPQSTLAFSGNLVHNNIIKIGKKEIGVHVGFPPYTEREMDFFKYVDEIGNDNQFIITPPDGSESVVFPDDLQQSQSIVDPEKWKLTPVVLKNHKEK